MSKPIRVAITGAAGQIGYSLLYPIAQGAMLGADQPVILQLLELPVAAKALDGVAMELVDCGYPLLHGIETSTEPMKAFKDADVIMLVGSKPRGPGQSRADLIRDNGPIFVGQGQAIDQVASKDAKIIVVGNPCNTNCLIAAAQSKRIPRQNFTAMTRLDHNRALGQIASKAGTTSNAIKNVIIWGNHSDTMVPDLEHATVSGKPALSTLDGEWLKGAFDTTVRTRGKQIIDARGKSSAASAAQSAMDHIHDWAKGTGHNDYTSMAVPSDGSYGVPEGLIFSFPCRVKSPWQYEIVKDLKVSDDIKSRMKKTIDELVSERETVRDLLV